MATRDLHNNLKTVVTRKPGTAAATADFNGTAVDTLGFEGVEVFVYMAASGDTLSGSVYTTLELEESNDNTTFTDVAEVDMIGAIDGTTTGAFAVIDDPAEDDALFRVGYVGNKRYVRVVVNVTGTHTNGTAYTTWAVLGHGRQMPAGVAHP